MHQRGAHTYYPAALFWEASRTILHYSHRGGVRLLVAGPAQAEFGTPFNAARLWRGRLEASPWQPATARHSLSSRPPSPSGFSAAAAVEGVVSLA